MDKEAYELGVQLALADTELLPLEKVAILAPALGAIAAPEGEGWRGAAGASLGAGLGGLAGTLGGSLIGTGLGAGIGALAGGGDGAAAGAGAGLGIGGLLGGVGGGIYGGMKGYDASIMDDEKKKALFQRMLVEQKMKGQAG